MKIYFQRVNGMNFDLFDFQTHRYLSSLQKSPAPSPMTKQDVRFSSSFHILISSGNFTAASGSYPSKAEASSLDLNHSSSSSCTVARIVSIRAFAASSACLLALSRRPRKRALQEAQAGCRGRPRKPLCRRHWIHASCEKAVRG